jgi:hypothetical protein
METLTKAEIKFQEHYEMILGKPLKSASLVETIKARAAVHAALADGFAGIAILKTHYVLGMFNGFPTINPEASAGAVYLVRDPRDVAVSLANHLGKPIDETIGAMAIPNLKIDNQTDNVTEIWGSWSQNVESWTRGSDDSLLTVRYEDMASDPVGSFTRIADHLRKSAPPEQIAEATKRCSFAELRLQEEQHGFHDRPLGCDRFFVAGKAGRWREVLTAKQAAAIVDAHGPTMARFGYLDS